jgi:hypothetical protein
MMKKIILLAGIWNAAIAFSQQEFANENFYLSLRKILEDGKTGFTQLKGTPKPNELKGIIEQYSVKMMLPGTDSGELVIPIIGGLYAEYYLKPARTKAEAVQRLAALKGAVQTATGKYLYEKAEPSAAGNYYADRYYYFTSSDTSLTILADYGASIYNEKGLYKISFRIMGVPGKKAEEKKTKLAVETDLEGKLRTFFTDASTYFSSLKGELKNTDPYGQTYDTKMTLFGLKGKVEDHKLECELKFSVSFIELSGIQEANTIFEQLKSALKKSLGDKISFASEEQSKYDPLSYSVTGKDIGASFIQTRNYITLSIKRDTNYPAVYLTFNRKKY